MQISKRAVHSDTHRERSQSERSQSERSQSERSQDERNKSERIHGDHIHRDRTLCPVHEGRPLRAWRMCVCVRG